jgi:hypothetical protein
MRRQARRRTRVVALALWALGLTWLTAAPALAAQDASSGRPEGHRHGAVLFVVQAEARSTVPPARSEGSATGAFVVDVAKGTMEYDLTFAGLPAEGPRAIALYNSGPGANGRLVRALCDSATPCPTSAEANLTGRWTQREIRLDPALLSELASGRIYLEIAGREGQPELRGQLEPNGAMAPVRNFMAHLTPASERDTSGAVGTAVVSEVHLPNGQVSLFYRVTVAKTRTRPVSASLVGVAARADTSTRGFLRLPAARTLVALPRRAPSRGGTLTAQVTVPARRRPSPVPSLLLPGRQGVGIVVTTEAMPRGELYGSLRSVP